MPRSKATRTGTRYALKEVAGSIHDVFGGRSRTHEDVIQQIENDLLRELKIQAFHREADAVLRVRMHLGDIHGRMLYGIASGTLVTLRDAN